LGYAQNPGGHGEHVDKVLKTITKCLKEASSVLKRSRYNHSIKPYWNDHLKQMSKAEKTVWHEWRDNGRPRSGSLYNSYKEAKKTFRKAMKMAEMEYQKQEMLKIANSSDLDQKFVWHMVNKAKKKKKRIIPVTVNEKTVCDPDDIRQQWKEYFCSLYNPQDHTSFDDTYKVNIETELEEMEITSQQEAKISKLKLVSNAELSKCIKSLKSNKAAGWDGITAEHIKYGGEYLVSTLCQLFDVINETETIPMLLKKGVIIPIPKGEQDETIMSNNRGITLLPVIGKLYEKLLLKRHLDSSDEMVDLDQLQGASQNHCSSLQTTWLLREVISHNLERDSTVYVALLDLSKAFDSVWVKAMFYKLLKEGMNTSIWRIMKNFYSDFQCCVQIGGKYSQWFVTEQGVHQGAPWSMYLFMRYINDLLLQLRQSNLGAMISTLKVGNPCYADDLALVTLHKPLLQSLINICLEYSRKWRLHFNCGKSVVLIFGNDASSTMTLHLGNHPICQKDGHPHMGVMLASKKSCYVDSAKANSQRAIRTFYALQSIGSRAVPLTPKVTSKLYWSVCIPRMVYGMEVLDGDDAVISVMEKAHRTMAKITQGLPTNTANAACLATLGWRTIAAHVDALKMMFLWRILATLPVQCLYKQVALVRLAHHLFIKHGKHHGPSFDIVQTYNKYGLTDVLLNGVTTGVYMSVNEMKRLIHTKLGEAEKDRFLATTLLYKSLSFYNKCITAITMWPWWIFLHQNPWLHYKVKVVCKLLFSHGCLSESRVRYSEASSLCKQCNMHRNESCGHMLFECNDDNLSKTRCTYWQVVIDAMPPAMLQDICKMSSDEKAVFLFSALNTTYIAEWDCLYCAILNFIYCMYICRKQLLPIQKQ
jgi:hypothetical protein